MGSWAPHPPTRNKVDVAGTIVLNFPGEDTGQGPEWKVGVGSLPHVKNVSQENASYL